MSAKHLKNLALIGVAATALVFGFAAPASAQKRSADRAETGEFGLQIMDFPGVSAQGTHGAAIDVDGDVAWGFSGSYNFTNRFSLGGEATWANPDYRLKLIRDNGAAPPTALPLINASLDVSTLMFKGTFNFLDGPLTPFVEVGAGWVYIDSNVVSGTPSTGCWWDPWWGYVCSTFYDTYSDTRTAWTYSAGVRWDMSDSIALRLSYGQLDLDSSHATSDVKLDAWRGEILWKF